MLVMLLPGQIAEKWDILRYGVEEAVPPTISSSPRVMNNILMSLLDGSAQCWVEYKVEEEKIVVYGFVITTIMEDFLSGVRNLLIYSLFGARPIEDDIWIRGLETMRKYARANGCEKVMAYSNIDRIEEIVKSLGGEIEWKFISFPV